MDSEYETLEELRDGLKTFLDSHQNLSPKAKALLRDTLAILDRAIKELPQ